MLPNFVHIGAPKAASTWLWKVCAEHPDIYVPEAKPVNFFVAEYHKGIDWDAVYDANTNRFAQIDDPTRIFVPVVIPVDGGFSAFSGV